VAGARRGLASCSLVLGRRALDASHPDQAESWFRLAIQYSDRDDFTRAATLGLGDILVVRGDYAGAALRFQEVISGGQPTDSLTGLATDRLNRIARAGTHEA
jgi:hypothetical protein